jgi:hypothetical protein
VLAIAKNGGIFEIRGYLENQRIFGGFADYLCN